MAQAKVFKDSDTDSTKPASKQFWRGGSVFPEKQEGNGPIDRRVIRVKIMHEGPKHPWRSTITSDLKSVTPITYLSMCMLLIWYGAFW